ncbi:HNH endonuclease [Arenimonas aestuarii]
MVYAVVAAKRKGLGKNLRFEVFKRDGFRCQYCGASAPDVLLVVDHIHPVAGGGKNDILNLITACEPCNAGKGKRELGDHTVLEKQRDQLQELSDRREQLEMMIQWKEGLCDLRALAVDRMADLWSRLVPGYVLNEHGRQTLRKLAGQFEAGELMEAMQIATSQYLEYKEDKPTQESVEVAWNRVAGICRIRELEKTKPYIKDLYYVRGILRKRVYVDEYRIMGMLEDSHLAGIPTDQLKRAARNCRNWTEFQADLLEAAEGVA